MIGLRKFVKHLVLGVVARDLQVENARLRTELEQVTELALVDALTGLLNRRALDNTLADMAHTASVGHINRRARRAPETYGFLSIDLAGFKRVNDEFGHAAGDRALVDVARAIRASLRTSDRLVFRPGGDEFVVLLDDVNVEEATIVAKRVVAKIEAIQHWSLSARIGGVVWSLGEHPFASPADILRTSDDLQVALRNAGHVGLVDIRSYEP